MAEAGNAFIEKLLIGKAVEIGQSAGIYAGHLLSGEDVELEFLGLRDGAVFTRKRLLAWNRQGITGRKIEFSSFRWSAVSAFSLENSGTFDLDAEVKLCGSGWGVCKLHFIKGEDIRPVMRYLAERVL